jgi:hypothetical protein
MKRLMLLATLVASLFLPLSAYAADTSSAPDFPASSQGHWFTQTNTAYGPSFRGFLVHDDQDANMWSEFQRLGGVQVAGYPVSFRFKMDGFLVQAFQKMILQWHPDTGQVQIVNVLDKLHDAGQDGFLQTVRQTPPPADNKADTGKTWPQVVAAHQGLLDDNAAIKAAYFADSDPISHYGLPVTGPVDEGNVIVVRCQRVVFQQWKTAVPWAAAGQVTIANGGDITKEAGLVPLDAALPAYPSAAWVSAGPFTRDSWDIALKSSDLASGFAAFPGKPLQPPLQARQKAQDDYFAPLDAHGLVNVDIVEYGKGTAFPNVVVVENEVRIFQSPDGAHWSFADLANSASSTQGAKQLPLSTKLGDEAAAVQLDVTDSKTGAKFTAFDLVVRSANVAIEVGTLQPQGQGSINDVIKDAQINLMRLGTQV